MVVAGRPNTELQSVYYRKSLGCAVDKKVDRKEQL